MFLFFVLIDKREYKMDLFIYSIFLRFYISIAYCRRELYRRWRINIHNKYDKRCSCLNPRCCVKCAVTRSRRRRPKYALMCRRNTLYYIVSSSSSHHHQGKYLFAKFFYT